MLVEACVRVVPNGSILHDKYDTENMDLVQMYRRTNLNRVVPDYNYNPFNYEKYKIDWYSGVESALLSCVEYAVVFVGPTNHYHCYRFDGGLDVKKVPDIDPYVTSDGPGISLTTFQACGVEVTEFCQLRYTSNIFKIACDVEKIYTSKGVFDLPIDVDRLLQWRKDFSVYKDIRDSQAWFGYLFTDTGYLVLGIDRNGNLMIKEVPRNGS